MPALPQRDGWQSLNSLSGCDRETGKKERRKKQMEKEMNRRILDVFIVNSLVYQTILVWLARPLSFIVLGSRKSLTFTTWGCSPLPNHPASTFRVEWKSGRWPFNTFLVPITLIRTHPLTFLISIIILLSKWPQQFFNFVTPGYNSLIT